jgi:hypothetical protein
MHDTAFDPHADAPYAAAPASIIDHDDYLLEVEPSMHPSSPPSPQPTQDPTSAALLSLLQRARAQTGEQPKAATKAAAKGAPKAQPEPSPAEEAELSDIADIAFVAGIAGSADDLVAPERSARGERSGRGRGQAVSGKLTRKERRAAAARAADDTPSDDDLIIDEDDFEIGDLDDMSAFGGAHEPDAFGEEDSGPVPTSASGSQRRSARAASSRGGRRATRRQTASTLGDFADRAKRAAGRIPPRAQLVAIVALMVVGLAYVFFGGDDPSATSEATAQAAAAAPAAASDLNAGPRDVVNPSDPNMELIPLDGAGAEVASQNHPLFPLSVLAADAKPMNTKQVKMSRTCVLREGPSSRFKALVKQTPATAKVIVLGESESDWKVISTGGLTGWSKTSCTGSGVCDLRQGPGAPFKAVTSSADSLKVNGPLVSGDRWRYVKFEDLYGWMGPACWK